MGSVPVGQVPLGGFHLRTESQVNSEEEDIFGSCLIAENFSWKIAEATLVANKS